MESLYIARGFVDPIAVAAISGAEPAPSVRVVDGAISGVNFSLSWAAGSGSVQMSGVYLGPSAVHRVQLEYVAAGGVIRGASTHEVTCVSTTSLFVVSSQLGIGARRGVPVDEPIATLSHPDAIEVVARQKGSAMGLAVELEWTPGSPSTGTLRISGSPTAAGTQTLRVEYMWQGLVIGQSTHTIDVGESSTRPAPAAIPAPAPAAPPSLPSPPGPRASSIGYSDPHLSDRYLVLNGDKSAGMLYRLPLDVQQSVALWEDDILGRFSDVVVNGLEMFGVYPVSSDGGGVGFGFVAREDGTALSVRAPAFMAFDYPLRSAPDVLSAGEMTVEAFVRTSPATSVMWSDPGPATRWMPIISAQALRRQPPAGGAREQGWSLGLISYVDAQTGLRRVRPAFVASLHPIVDNEDLAFYYDGSRKILQEDRPWRGDTLARMRFAAESLWPTRVAKFGITMAMGVDIPAPWDKWLHLAAQIHEHPSIAGAFVTSCWLEGIGGSAVDVFGPLPPAGYAPTYQGWQHPSFSATPTGVFHSGNPCLLGLRAGWMTRPAILDAGGGRAPAQALSTGVASATMTPFSGGIASIRLSRRAEYTKSSTSTLPFRADIFPIAWPTP